MLISHHPFLDIFGMCYTLGFTTLRCSKHRPTYAFGGGSESKQRCQRGYPLIKSIYIGRWFTDQDWLLSWMLVYRREKTVSLLIHPVVRYINEPTDSNWLCDQGQQRKQDLIFASAKPKRDPNNHQKWQPGRLFAVWCLFQGHFFTSCCVFVWQSFCW